MKKENFPLVLTVLAVVFVFYLGVTAGRWGYGVERQLLDIGNVVNNQGKVLTFLQQESAATSDKK